MLLIAVVKRTESVMILRRSRIRAAKQHQQPTATNNKQQQLQQQQTTNNNNNNNYNYNNNKQLQQQQTTTTTTLAATTTALAATTTAALAATAAALAVRVLVNKKHAKTTNTCISREKHILSYLFVCRLLLVHCCLLFVFGWDMICLLVLSVYLCVFLHLNNKQHCSLQSNCV